MSILQVRDVGIAFGGVHALKDVSFDVEEGGVFAIIGPNGAGKTTLFNIVSGLYRPSSGSVELDGVSIIDMRPYRLARLGLSRTFQNLQIFFQMSALENVMVGRHTKERSGLMADLLGLPISRQQDQASENAARALLARVGLGDREDQIAGNLAYGELKKLEIARALAAQPRVLLLDEPAAGCNATETRELAELIADTAKAGVTIVLVEHDMKLVMSISDRVLVLREGRRLAEGTPQEISRNQSVIDAYLGLGKTESEHA